MPSRERIEYDEEVVAPARNGLRLGGKGCGNVVVPPTKSTEMDITATTRAATLGEMIPATELE
jgi:hypothetical protein